MKIQKFGGTSVGTAQRMKNVAKQIINNGQNIVVLSAMSGTTNSLVEISDYLYKKNNSGALDVINSLERKYLDVIGELYTQTSSSTEAKAAIAEIFQLLREKAESTLFSLFDEKIILAQGELLSTILFNIYLHETGINSVLLPALDFMQTNKNAEPDMPAIKEKLTFLLEQTETAELYVTQGFICRNSYGEIDNLQRGGSDYTASVIGAAVRASEIQIWTDIDGMHNNDPRFVEGTKPVSHLHFEEAAELAYFGAKILHPTCILPAKQANIPVRLLNTLQPEAAGTLISNENPKKNIEAIAAKDGITAIKIKSGRMLLAYGFLGKVFDIFARYQTSIDMITTSEVGVSVTIDDNRNLEHIEADLRKLGTVTVDKNMVIICVVGDMNYENTGFQAKVVGALKNIPLRMISYGGSNYNVSLLVKAEDKIPALNALSENLF